MGELVSRLMTPFLPVEARYRLRQQRIDAEAAALATDVLNRKGVSVTVLKSTVGAGIGGDIWLSPTHPYHREVPKWFASGLVGWDGNLLTVIGERGTAFWYIQRGGVQPGFGADEVAEAGQRPVTSGECPASVVEIAGVAVSGFPLRRLYFLDREGRHLTAVPALGLVEEDVIRLAKHAGVAFRMYSLRTSGAVMPEPLCDALFPRSARHWRVLGIGSEAADWWWPGWPSGRG